MSTKLLSVLLVSAALVAPGPAQAGEAPTEGRILKELHWPTLTAWERLSTKASDQQPVLYSSTLTARERLSTKASDEQRLDNCKVPLEQRGPKPRPDTCGAS